MKDLSHQNLNSGRLILFNLKGKNRMQTSPIKQLVKQRSQPQKNAPASPSQVAPTVQSYSQRFRSAANAVYNSLFSANHTPTHGPLDYHQAITKAVNTTLRENQDGPLARVVVKGKTIVAYPICASQLLPTGSCTPLPNTDTQFISVGYVNEDKTVTYCGPVVVLSVTPTNITQQGNCSDINLNRLLLEKCPMRFIANHLVLTPNINSTAEYIKPFDIPSCNGKGVINVMVGQTSAPYLEVFNHYVPSVEAKCIPSPDSGSGGFDFTRIVGIGVGTPLFVGCSAALTYRYYKKKKERSVLVTPENKAGVKEQEKLPSKRKGAPPHTAEDYDAKSSPSDPKTPLLSNEQPQLYESSGKTHAKVGNLPTLDDNRPTRVNNHDGRESKGEDLSKIRRALEDFDSEMREAEDQ